ncbi:E3 ubiquitin-protein ligase TRIM56 [Holothuria leucospilota]|uniref:E3 ubiquitin-protein ligase TRIM56 n=1 Tax=Holothuria leucospilota TaxID=206669 RepID=A0A9Q0YSD4_HOLLE|nr:E3 ubiquitin-protein ligase TRIM56 [Holothuria leucospilota]
MASDQLVYHIYEEFCQCAVCLKPFSEPKLLPCLHRFCKECLSPLFVNLTAGDIFYCPLCRAELSVTEGGIEDIKSDFLVRELTKVIQLQKTLQSENQKRQCVGCEKEEKSAGFCSKCGGFLCENCFTVHQTFKASMLKDHQPVIDLKDVILGKVKIGMEKLWQLTTHPRCQNHPENILRLACVTCECQQICIACTYEDHVEHKAESIKNMAGKYRDDLQTKIDELRLMVTDWENNFAKLKTIREKLSSAELIEVTASVRRITEEKLQKLEAERESDLLCSETKVSELKERGVLEKTRLENERNEKIKEIERQYDELLKKHNIDTNNNIAKVREDNNIRVDKIEKKITQLKAHCDEMINAVSKQRQQQNMDLERLMSDLSNTQKRFENFITTGSSVLALANDWSAVENIPSLSFAFDGIKDDIEELKLRLSEFEHESKLPIPIVTQSNKLEEVGFIERHKYLDSETDVSDIPLDNVDNIVFLKSSDYIVMSGNSIDEYSAAVIKTTVTGDKQEYLKRFKTCSEANPYCLICNIDEDIIAIACDKYLGIMNVKESTYNRVKVMGKGRLRCVCSDMALRQLLTHQADEDIVKVYDLNLKLVKTRKLPFSPPSVGMLVHNGMLIVENENNMYVLSEGDEVLRVISPPGLPKEEGEEWRCWYYCCSGDGKLYALWRKSDDAETAEISAGYIIVYTPTYYPLEMISSEANCFALMEKDGSRKVIALSQDTLNIYKAGQF